MRTVVAVAAIVALCAVPAAAQVSGFIEDEARFLSDPKLGQLHFYVQGSLASESKWGWWAWAFVSDTYSNAYPGLSYKPAEWFQVGVGAGLESVEDTYRVGSFLWMGKGRWSVLALHEVGTTKPWTRVVGKADISAFGLGCMTDSFLGVGPRAEVRLGTPELRTIVWTAGLWDRKGSASVLVGVRLGFE